MADWLVLEDFVLNPYSFRAGTTLEDGPHDVAALIANGLSAVEWVEPFKSAFTPYLASYNNYRRRPVSSEADADLTSLLVAFLQRQGGTAPVTSVFGRLGAVAAAVSDYDASQIDNDSSVTGATVDVALDTLDAAKASIAHAATHSEGGSDEISVEDLGTTEADSSLRLSPDGSGGLAFTPSPAAVPQPLERTAAPGEYWVDSVGGSDANDGTIGSPWETFGPFADFVEGIHVAHRQTLNLVHNVAGPDYDVTRAFEWAQISAPITINGSKNELAGSAVMGVGSTAHTITGTFIDGQYENAYIEVLTGALAGEVRLVARTTAAVGIELSAALSAVPVGGVDTFRVIEPERAGSQLNMAASSVEWMRFPIPAARSFIGPETDAYLQLHDVHLVGNASTLQMPASVIGHVVAWTTTFEGSFASWGINVALWSGLAYREGGTLTMSYDRDGSALAGLASAAPPGGLAVLQGSGLSDRTGSGSAVLRGQEFAMGYFGLRNGFPWIPASSGTFHWFGGFVTNPFVGSGTIVAGEGVAGDRPIAERITVIGANALFSLSGNGVRLYPPGAGNDAILVDSGKLRSSSSSCRVDVDDGGVGANALSISKGGQVAVLSQNIDDLFNVISGNQCTLDEGTTFYAFTALPNAFAAVDVDVGRFVNQTAPTDGQIRVFDLAALEWVATTVAHADLAAIGTDDHHAEVHTIASHDTTATGAQLDTLVGGGATALHTHVFPVDSIFGRTGVVVAEASDYDASQVDNDSGVAGAFVSGALDSLDTAITDHVGDTANPHSTDINNLGSGTLAELNAIVTDATLDDAGNARTPTAHSHTAANIVTIPSLDGQVLTSDGVGNATWETPGSGVTDHGLLTGLADDDHTQYLLVDGSRALSGNLDVGGFDVTNVGNVDGRDVSADGTQLEQYLSAGLGTGLRNGGVLSVGAPNTTFSVSDGTGYVIDSTTVPGTPTITSVNWSGQTNIPVTNIATQLITFVSINAAGAVVQQTNRWTPDQYRTHIVLGVVVHVDQATVDTVNNEQHTALDATGQISDILDGLGFFNKQGNVFTASGANLQIDKSAGVMVAQGANWPTDPLNPHQLTLPALTGATFQYRFQDGTNGATGTSIDPSIYDVGGTSTSVPTNRYTIQRIYSFTSNNVKIQPGQVVYNSMADARADLQIGDFVTEPSIAANGLLRGFLIVRQGTTDLSNTANAQFLEASRLGDVTGAAGLSVSTLQAAYTNSAADPKITTNGGGAVQFRRGTALDSDAVFQIENGAGTTTAAIAGDGTITTSSTVDGRDVAADGNTLDVHVADLTNPHATTHAQVTGQTADDHHNQVHDIGGADHTGTLTDALHGSRGGASQHAAVIAGGAAGFMTGADKTKLDGIEALANVTDAANVAAAGAVMDSDFTGSYAGQMTRTGAGAYVAVKHNLAATGAPTATDDSASDYAVGSDWIDTTNDNTYRCVDATASAAVWVQTNGAGGGVSDMQGAYDGGPDITGTDTLVWSASGALTNNTLMLLDASADPFGAALELAGGSLGAEIAFPVGVAGGQGKLFGFNGTPGVAGVGIRLGGGEGGAGAAGGAIDIDAGNGEGVGAGAVVNVTAGAGGATGAGGDATLAGGDGGATSGDGGSVLLVSGGVTSGNVGHVEVSAVGGAAVEFQLIADNADITGFVAGATGPGSTDLVYVMPVDAPTAGQVLAAAAPSGGQSVLSWETGGGGGGVSDLQGAYDGGATITTASDVPIAITADIAMAQPMLQLDTDAGTGAAALQLRGGSLATEMELFFPDTISGRIGRIVGEDAAGASGLAGVGILLQSGDGDGAGAGGVINLTGGTGGGVGAAINVIAGPGTSGNGGQTEVNGGQGNGGNGGNLRLGGGWATGGNGGNVFITGGDGSVAGTWSAVGGNSGGGTNPCLVRGCRGGGGGSGGEMQVAGGFPGASSVGGRVSIFTENSNGANAGPVIDLSAGDGGASGGIGGAITGTAGAGTVNNAGGVVTWTAGAGQGTAAGGVASSVGGAGGATGAGGAASLTGGAGGATSGVGGAASVTGGAATAGSVGGVASLTGGAGAGAGAGAATNVTGGTGGATGAGGVTTVAGGVGGATTGNGGNLVLNGGAGGAGGGNGGTVIITAGDGSQGGAFSLIGGISQNSGANTCTIRGSQAAFGLTGGALNLEGGFNNQFGGTGKSGAVNILTQESNGSNDGPAINITPGAAGSAGSGGPIIGTGGVGGTASGAGGAVTWTGGAGTLNAAGGAASLVGGDGHGTGAGAAVDATGGAGGATGAGGDATVAGGAGGSTSGNGGNVILAPGSATSGTAGNVNASDSDIVDVKTATFGAGPATSSGTGAQTIDWNDNQNQEFTFGAGNATFTFTAPPGTGQFTLVLIQDGTGSRTATWPGGSTVQWPGGTAPTLSTGAGAVDIIKFYYDGTTYYGEFALNFS